MCYIRDRDQLGHPKAASVEAGEAETKVLLLPNDELYVILYSDYI